MPWEQTAVKRIYAGTCKSCQELFLYPPDEKGGHVSLHTMERGLEQVCGNISPAFAMIYRHAVTGICLPMRVIVNHRCEENSCKMPYGALVGKIGASGTPFLIGSSTTINPTVDDTLYLAVNDNLPFYGDNHGWYIVTVRQ
jgi:hypothetical protein